MDSKFVVGHQYRVYGETFKMFRVVSRTARTITVRIGGSNVVLHVKVNPYHEPENVGVEYADVGEDTTIENYVSANDNL